MTRQQQVSRKTQETDIQVGLNLDGRGEFSVTTSIPFLDHMLALFARHGLFDLTVRATGDTAVDYHHTMEDVGICLGNAFKKALGDKKGIRRFGQASVPMIDSLATVVLDLSGRAHLTFRVEFASSRVGELDVELFEEFFRAFSTAAGIDLHVHVPYGSNVHHSVEAIFKAFARACEQAVRIDPRMEGVWSTKGTL
jgi:imidazoleglycerol-phosphate dehydratase